jgi:hypothetical protein
MQTYKLKRQFQYQKSIAMAISMTIQKNKACKQTQNLNSRLAFQLILIFAIDIAIDF